MMALEPRYPSKGGSQLEGSDDLPPYLPGMRHPDPSVTHHGVVAKDNSQPPLVYINVGTLQPKDICVSSSAQHPVSDLFSTGPQWEREGSGRNRKREGRGERRGREKDYLSSIIMQDLGSLLKEGDTRGLILVSFGATVMRIPKQQLAMATLSCWRALLTEARNSKR